MHLKAPSWLKKIKPKKIAKTAIKRSLQAVLVFHLGTQAYHTSNDLDHRFCPSPERAAFREEFGFPLDGFKEDIEDNKGALPRLALVLHYERSERALGINSIEVFPENYLKKPLIEQMFHLAGGDDKNHYRPIINDIAMGKYALHSFYAVHHEIKHAKTFSVLEEYPEFKEKWEALARDETGNSLYQGRFKEFFSGNSLLGRILQMESFSEEENSKQGFISNYSRTDFYEDVAELCEEAESMEPNQLSRLLYEEQNQKIISKIELAQEYGLISPEFSEFAWTNYIYIQLDDEFPLLENTPPSEDTIERYNYFLRESGDFLLDNPNSVYSIAVRNLRGKVYEHLSPEFKNGTSKAVEEYKLGLASSVKDYYEYIAILERLSFLYASHGEKEKAELYLEANEKYHEGFKGNDISFALKGVNDFLEERGELLGDFCSIDDKIK